MKKLVRKDSKKRARVFSREKKLFVLKNIGKNYSFSTEVKNKTRSNMSVNFEGNSLGQTTNRCVMTGRKKRLNRMFSFSRICFLKLVRMGHLFGFRKSSW